MRSALKGVPGVHEVDVDYENERVTVRVESGKAQADDLIAALEGVNYKAWLRSSEIGRTKGAQ